MKISNLNFDEKINPEVCGLPLWMRCFPQKRYEYQCRACPCSLENLKPFYSVWDALRYTRVNRGTEEILQKSTEAPLTIEELTERINKEGREGTDVIISHPLGEPKIVDPDFWDYLIETGAETDHWWLDTWLEEKLDYYKKHTPCPNCNSRRSYKKEIWSKTGNWVLETHEKCRNCKHRLSVKDNRPEIRKGLDKGIVLYKDVKTLEKELEEK